MSDKPLHIYQIDITDTTRFQGYRTETIYGYAHAISEQLLTISTANGGRVHYNWSLVQSFKCAEFKEATVDDYLDKLDRDLNGALTPTARRVLKWAYS